MNANITKLLAPSLCLLMLAGCDAESEGDLDTPRGALLYDLNEVELEIIHATYGEGEDIEAMRERLTAPFNCSLYSAFCEQVGPDAAYQITGEMVDLALDEVPAQEIEAHLSLRIEQATALADELEAQGEQTFRASGNWSTQTRGDYRLRVRNGITTPLFGQRRAWTEAKAQHEWGWTWQAYNAHQLCVNAGTNTQWRFDYNTNDNLTVLESNNPGNSCVNLNNTRTISTYHARNNPPGGAAWLQDPHYFILEARGCASGNLNGLSFKLCASPFVEEYH